MTDGPELTNDVAGAVGRTNEQIAALLDDAAYYRRAGFPDEAAWREQRAADLSLMARLVQAAGEAKSALEAFGKVAKSFDNYSEDAEPLKRFPMELPVLDADGAATWTTLYPRDFYRARTALSLLQEGEAGGAG